LDRRSGDIISDRIETRFWRNHEGRVFFILQDFYVGNGAFHADNTYESSKKDTMVLKYGYGRWYHGKVWFCI
jgi:hypothetical protein